MRTILTTFAAASALALAVSSAYAGGGFGGIGGCSYDYQQVVESTAPEETIAMSTFDGSVPVVVEDEAAVTETVCADGDADCQTPPAE